MIAATRPLSWVSSPDFGPLVKIQAALFSKRLFCGNRGFISSAWPCCAFGVFTTSRRINNMLWSVSFPWCARHINIFWGISNSFYGCTCACRCVINILWSLWSVIFRSCTCGHPCNAYWAMPGVQRVEGLGKLFGQFVGVFGGALVERGTWFKLIEVFRLKQCNFPAAVSWFLLTFKLQLLI